MSLIQEIKALFESETGRGVLGQRVENTVDFGAGGGRVVLFTITGGEIYLRCLYGVCTIAETGAAQAIQFDCTPTVSTGLGIMDDGIGDINGLLVGAIIAPQGDITLPAVVAGPLTAGPSFSMPFICQTGTIGVNLTNATAAGTWRMVMYYVPLTIGAAVV